MENIKTIEELSEKGIVVTLNGKPMRNFFRAKEGENGWVEILDANTLPPAPLETVKTVFEEPEFTEVKTKLVKGKVDFVKLQ